MALSDFESACNDENDLRELEKKLQNVVEKGFETDALRKITYTKIGQLFYDPSSPTQIEKNEKQYNVRDLHSMSYEQLEFLLAFNLIPPDIYYSYCILQLLQKKNVAKSV